MITCRSYTLHGFALALTFPVLFFTSKQYNYLFILYLWSVISLAQCHQLHLLQPPPTKKNNHLFLRNFCQQNHTQPSHLLQRQWQLLHNNSSAGSEDQKRRCKINRQITKTWVWAAGSSHRCCSHWPLSLSFNRPNTRKMFVKTSLKILVSHLAPITRIKLG